MRNQPCIMKKCRKWRLRPSIPFCRFHWPDVPSRIKQCILNSWNHKDLDSYRDHCLAAKDCLQKSVDTNKKQSYADRN